MEKLLKRWVIGFEILLCLLDLVADYYNLFQGTHEELLALNGKYAEMWNMQLHSTRDSSQLNLTELDAPTSTAKEEEKKE